MGSSPKKISSHQRSRRFLRWYAGCRFRPGRSKIRAFLRWRHGNRVQAEVLPALWMNLDLSVFDEERLCYFSEEVDSPLQWLIRTLLPIGGTFVDCGANTGFFGLLAGQERLAKIVLVEPHPRYAKRLRENLALNDLNENGVVVEAAVSDHNGQARLTSDSTSGVTFHLVDGEHADTIEVEVRKADFLFGDGHVKRIDFLRIDNEGHEFAALNGLEENLRPETTRCISLEALDQRQDIVNLLRDRGYTGYGTRDLDFYDVCRFVNDCGIYPALFQINQAPADTIWVPKDSPESRLLERYCRLHTEIWNQARCR